MNNGTKTKKTIRIVVDILVYVIAGLLFSVAIVSFVLKLSGNSIKLFGHRLDVVLTDSMSEKNPEYEDFLKGHDDQIQAMDVVVTNTNITEEDLDVYDIVLFNNKMLGATDMHRIVNKTLKDQDELTITHSYFQTINGVTGLSFKNVSGGIASNVICMNEMTLVTYSTEFDEREHFKFSYSTAFYDVDVSREEKDGGYYTTYHLTSDSTSPRKLFVAHGCEYDYASEVICSCKIESTLGTIDVKEDNVTTIDDGYKGIYNTCYYYEIRGDKANTSDGTNFTIEDIYGKVENRIPKLGYPIRYLSSVWGIISLVGIGAIILAFDIIVNVMNKKEQKASAQDKDDKKEGKGEKNE